MDKLEPCPFCGADIEKKVVFAQPCGIHPQNDCHLKGKIMSAVHWNRRAPVEPPAAGAVDLEALISTLSKVCTYIESKEDLRPYSALTPGKGLHTDVLFHIADLAALRSLTPPSPAPAEGDRPLEMWVGLDDDGTLCFATFEEVAPRPDRAIHVYHMRQAAPASPTPVSPRPMKLDFDAYWGDKGEKWKGWLDIKEFAREVWNAARAGNP